MWVNVSLEKEFKDSLSISTTPSFVILRPHTSKVLNHDETAINEETLKKLLDKVSGGDGRFKKLKALPALILR